MAEDATSDHPPSSEDTLASRMEAARSNSKSPSVGVSSQTDLPESVSMSVAISTGSEPTRNDGNQIENIDSELSRTLSQRKSHVSGHEGKEWAQIEKLISRMFGDERKANSEEEKTRHAGVVWKNLTVKGVGFGAALQPTNGDLFLGIPRLIKRLLTRGRKGTGVGKPDLRTILNDFTVRTFLQIE